jgi:hypothetical protein
MNWVHDHERIGRWVREKAGGRYNDGCTGIALEKDGVIQVGVMYDDYTGRGGSILMHSRCDNPKATTRQFYWMIFWYPFEQLGVKRCTLLVHTSNKKALRLNDHLGFTREAVIKDYFPDGDAVIYRMYRNECSFLNGCDTAKTDQLEDVSQHEQKISPT